MKCNPNSVYSNKTSVILNGTFGCNPLDNIVVFKNQLCLLEVIRKALGYITFFLPSWLATEGGVRWEDLSAAPNGMWGAQWAIFSSVLFNICMHPGSEGLDWVPSKHPALFAAGWLSRLRPSELNGWMGETELVEA